jgi:large subunit ribosomal protein L18
MANRAEGRIRRHQRLRKRVFGTAQRPRLAVFRSVQHIYAQVIDDTSKTTLVSASTLEPEIKAELKGTGNAEAASAVGKLVAQRALDKGITQVIFDRGGNIYHGRVKALADSARQQGLQF